MRGLVWVNRRIMGCGRVFRKGCSICLTCVSRLGLDSVMQGGGGWDGKGLNVEQ